MIDTVCVCVCVCVCKCTCMQMCISVLCSRLRECPFVADKSKLGLLLVGSVF